MSFSLIGIASLFVFISTALASGITASDVIALANSARSDAGLPVLTENAQLTTAAENKARDMIKNDYFAHTSPTGVAPWHWIKESGYEYKAAGENLAINYTDAGEQHWAWMKSSTHRANILNTRYQEIGVAVEKGKINGKEAILTVELFGSPLHAAADRVAAVPPQTTIPVEIRGVETAVSETLPVVAVIAREPVPPSDPEMSPSIQNPLPEQIFLSLETQEALFIVLLFLSLISAPLALVIRTFSVIYRHSGGIPEPETTSVGYENPSVPMKIGNMTITVPIHGHSVHTRALVH